jgi:hypothetical protein
MCVQVNLQQIDDVPGNSRVAHYDELTPRAKDQLFKLVENEHSALQETEVDELGRHDVIKFTDYYQISIE